MCWIRWKRWRRSVVDFDTSSNVSYDSSVGAHSPAGIGLPKSERIGAHSKRLFCAHAMAGCAVAFRRADPQTGKTNSAHSATQSIGLDGGGSQLKSEGLAMSARLDSDSTAYQYQLLLSLLISIRSQNKLNPSGYYLAETGIILLEKWIADREENEHAHS